LVLFHFVWVNLIITSPSDGGGEVGVHPHPPLRGRGEVMRFMRIRVAIIPLFLDRFIIAYPHSMEENHTVYRLSFLVTGIAITRG